MTPITETDLKVLFRKMRTYRYIYFIYVVSAFLYAVACFGASPQYRLAPAVIANLALGFGALAAGAVFMGKWLAFRPAALRRKGLTSWEDRVQYTFLALLFLLAAGESIGLVAVTAAAFGGGPGWKLTLLPLWQLLVSLLITPERAHWDRLLSRWEDNLKGDSNNGS